MLEDINSLTMYTDSLPKAKNHQPCAAAIHQPARLMLRVERLSWESQQALDTK